MRIVIDGTTLLLPSAGVKNYVHYWLRSLAEASSQRGDTISTHPPGLNYAAGIEHRTPRRKPGTLLRLGLVHLCNARGSPVLDILLSNADLFHCSQHTLHRPRALSSTATIFDFSCWTTPEYHTDANVSATKLYASHILRNCDGLIAISGHAKRDAVEILGLPEERIRIIYPGVAEPFFSATEADAAAVRHTYALPKVYLLFVGCLEPRKNILGLIDAYQQLPVAARREAPLVLAGPFGWKSTAIRERIEALNLRYLGYVPEPDLAGLFRGAAAFVYPSHYEGFGLPVAQAMAAGVPVITSDRSSLPEVAGDAALLVDPDSPEALSCAIERVLTDSELPRKLSLLGQRRAEVFRWHASATASLDFFHEVSGR